MRTIRVIPPMNVQRIAWPFHQDNKAVWIFGTCFPICKAVFWGRNEMIFWNNSLLSAKIKTRNTKYSTVLLKAPKNPKIQRKRDFPPFDTNVPIWSMAPGRLSLTKPVITGISTGIFARSRYWTIFRFCNASGEVASVVILPTDSRIIDSKWMNCLASNGKITTRPNNTKIRAHTKKRKIATVLGIFLFSIAPTIGWTSTAVNPASKRAQSISRAWYDSQSPATNRVMIPSRVRNAWISERVIYGKKNDQDFYNISKTLGETIEKLSETRENDEIRSKIWVPKRDVHRYVE